MTCGVPFGDIISTVQNVACMPQNVNMYSSWSTLCTCIDREMEPCIVQVDKQVVGLIIGRKHANLKKIMAAYDVKITVTERSDFSVAGKHTNDVAGLIRALAKMYSKPKEYVAQFNEQVDAEVSPCKILL